MHKKTTALLYSLIALSTLHAAQEQTSCGETASPYKASARHIEGKGIGYKRGYTSVDLFIAPPSTLQHRFVPFFDGRLHIFDNGKIATNAGVGLRYICSSFVYGINSYYDYRETSHQKYNQYSLGLEALGKVWDFRLNGYLPVGTKKSDFYNTRFGYFQGNSMYLNTTREFAMKGLNAEAGIHIKNLSFMKVYGAFGPYYFEKQGQNAIGGKVRASLTFLDHIKIEASTSYDPIFHWIGQGELSFMIPFGPKKKLKRQPTCRRPYLNERAVQPVDRQEIIVVDHKHYSPIAIDPTTDTPYTFIFVDNLSHSLGTYESPYPTLLEAEDNSVPRDIIYVFPGDGTDTGMDQGITLQAKQKLFGSGIDIPLATTMGEMIIPKQSTSFPLITNQAGANAIVTLSDNNEVAGLNLTTDHSLGYGIVGGDPNGLTALIQTPYIHDNLVNVSNTTHVKVGLATVSATVLNNQVSSSDGDTKILIASSGNLLHTTVSGNTITSGDGFDGDGILLNATGDISNVIVSDNSITLGNGSTVQGIVLQGNNISKILIQNNAITIGNVFGGTGIYLEASEDISDVTISYNSAIIGDGDSEHGIFLQSIAGEISNVAMSYNSAATGDGNNGYGIFVQSNGDLSDVVMSHNSATTGDGIGIELFSSEGNISDITMSHNLATANLASTGNGIGVSGIELFSSGNLSNVTMFNNSATVGNGDNGTGIFFVSSSGNISDVSLSHNTASVGNGSNTAGIRFYPFSSNCSNILLSDNSAVMASETANGIAFFPHSDTDNSCVTLIDNTSNGPILLLNSGAADLILNTPASHGNVPEPTTTGSTGPVLFETCGE